MARPIARLNDRTTGTCSHPSHIVPITVGGRITTASTDMSVNNRGIARLHDQVTTDCGHVSYIITASGNTSVNNRPAARLNDRVGNGPYEATIITGSPDSLIN
jgi:uncharacterized Zn-binding protein involved in type VI secretion